jgi:hypothetical protein
MEISRLKGLEAEQTIAIGKRFNSLSAIFSTIVSLFPKSTTAADGEKSPGFFDQDIVGLLSRFVLPFALNKTIFRHSNFVVKALVGLVSQKASHFITEESVAALWEKVITLFKSKSADIPEHRAIPALSETY